MTHTVIQQVPLTLIKDDGPNVRDTDDGEKDITVSIDKVGLLQFPRVMKVGDFFVPVTGSRRCRAARELGWKTIPVIIEERDLSAAEVIQRQLIENHCRKNLHPMQEARGIAEYIDLAGVSESEAAEELGYENVVTVSRFLSLLTLPVPIQEQVGKKISTSAALELVKITDPDRQAALARDVADGRLTRDEVSTEVKRQKKGKKSKPKTAHPRAVALLGGARSITLSGPDLNSTETLITWLEELLAQARKSRTLSLETFLSVLRDHAHK